MVHGHLVCASCWRCECYITCFCKFKLNKLSLEVIYVRCLASAECCVVLVVTCTEEVFGTTSFCCEYAKFCVPCPVCCCVLEYNVCVCTADYYCKVLCCAFCVNKGQCVLAICGTCCDCNVYCISKMFACAVVVTIHNTSKVNCLFEVTLVHGHLVCASCWRCDVLEDVFLFYFCVNFNFELYSVCSVATLQCCNNFKCCHFAWKSNIEFAISDCSVVASFCQRPCDSNCFVCATSGWEFDCAIFSNFTFKEKVALFEFNLLCIVEFWSVNVGDTFYVQWVDLVKVGVAGYDTLDCCSLTNFEFSEQSIDICLVSHEVVCLVDVVLNTVYCEVVVFVISLCEDCFFQNYKFVLVLHQNVVVALVLCTAPSFCYVFEWQLFSSSNVTCLNDLATLVEFVLTTVNCTCTSYANFGTEWEVSIQCFFGSSCICWKRWSVSVVTVTISILQVQGTLRGACYGNCTDNVCADCEGYAVCCFAVSKVVFVTGNYELRNLTSVFNFNGVTFCIGNCCNEFVSNFLCGKFVYVNFLLECVSVDFAKSNCCLTFNCALDFPSNVVLNATDRNNCCDFEVNCCDFVASEVQTVNVLFCISKSVNPFVLVTTSGYVTVTIAISVYVDNFNVLVTNVALTIVCCVNVFERCSSATTIALTVVVGVCVSNRETCLFTNVADTVVIAVYVCFARLLACCHCENAKRQNHSENQD